MTDTQWPRFEVFVQEKSGEAYQDAGSVHAPDAEMALMNARDVFARRPVVVSMWVIPARAIFSKTKEELARNAHPSPGPAHDSGGLTQTYHVFCKLRPAGTQIQVGAVEAFAAAEALALAVETFSDRFPRGKPPSVWWIFPAACITASRPDDIASMYAPAGEKGFRMSTDFRTHTAMRRIQRPPNDG